MGASWATAVISCLRCIGRICRRCHDSKSPYPATSFMDDGASSFVIISLARPGVSTTLHLGSNGGQTNEGIVGKKGFLTL